MPQSLGFETDCGLLKQTYSYNNGFLSNPLDGFTRGLRLSQS